MFKNIDENKQVQFLDIDTVEDKLFFLFGTNANVLSGITSYPQDKRILIGIAKIDVLEDKMKLDAIYYPPFKISYCISILHYQLLYQVVIIKR